jgi:hypothetical protein
MIFLLTLLLLFRGLDVRSFAEDFEVAGLVVFFKRSTIFSRLISVESNWLEVLVGRLRFFDVSGREGAEGIDQPGTSNKTMVVKKLKLVNSLFIYN